MMSDALDGSRLFAQIARDLAEQAGLEQTTRRIIELATQLTGCTAAAVWALTPHGSTTLKAATDRELGAALDHIITAVGEGPVHDALAHRATVRLSDVTTETRWPRYLAALRDERLPIGSAIAYSLELGGQHLGALALYAAEPDFFTEQLSAIGAVLADHAAIALETATLVDNNYHLKEALRSNRRIGMAIGILMALHRYDERQAFDTLRIASQHTHRKVRDVAEEVIMTGATPEWSVRQPANGNRVRPAIAAKLPS